MWTARTKSEVLLSDEIQKTSHEISLTAYKIIIIIVITYTACLKAGLQIVLNKQDKIINKIKAFRVSLIHCDSKNVWINKQVKMQEVTFDLSGSRSLMNLQWPFCMLMQCAKHWSITCNMNVTFKLSVNLSHKTTWWAVHVNFCCWVLPLKE